jgi:hypothetical protein
VIKEEAHFTDRDDPKIQPNNVELNMDSAEQYGSRTKRPRIQGPIL